MDRTRNAASLKQQWTPGLVLTLLGFVFWILGTTGQLIWNGFGAISKVERGLVEDMSEVNIFRCVGQGIAFGQTDGGCAMITYPLAGWALFFTFASLWWNPILRRRWIDRAFGLKEYYKLQLILATARCATWYFLGDKQDMSYDPLVVQAVHATMLAFNVIVPIVAYRTAYIGKKPKISFQDKYEPLVQPKQRREPVAAQTHWISPLNSQSSVSPAPPTFPFHKFSTRKEPEIPPYQPPTPPPEDDETDAMDVDTPKKNYNLGPSIHRQPQVMQHGPSPFYGKLPPAPISQEHRLRNPPNKPSFQKTSPEMQEKFFQSMTGRTKNIANASKSKPEPIMREQRLFTERDRKDAETGLESWFSDFFTLGEVPQSVARPAIQVPQDAISLNPYFAKLRSQIVPVLVLFMSSCMWSCARRWPSISIYLYFSSIGLAAVVAATRLKWTLRSAQPNHSDLLLCAVELYCVLAFGYQMRQAVMLDFDIEEVLKSLPYWFFGFMIIQESLAYITLLRQGLREEQRILSQTRPQYGEYYTPQIQPTTKREDSPPQRERKALPFDGVPRSVQSSALALAEPQTPARNPAATSFFEQRVTRSQAKVKQSPGSNAFSGLSLGIEGSVPGMRRSARTLKRGPNPWEVGRM